MSSSAERTNPTVEASNSQPTGNKSLPSGNIISPQGVNESLAMAQEQTDRLSRRVDPAHDFTYRDELMITLEDLIKCPILLDTSDDMIIFNLQCYDKASFETHKRNEQARNRIREDSGYSDFTLKDPRTNTNFEYRSASMNIMHSDYIPRPSLISMVLVAFLKCV